MTTSDTTAPSRSRRLVRLLRRAALAAVIGIIVLTVASVVGNAATTQLGFDCLTKGGKLVIVGLFGGDLTLPLPTIPMRAISIVGSYTGTLDELKELVDLAKSGKLGDIPTVLIRQDQVNEAHENLKQGHAQARQVIAYD